MKTRLISFGCALALVTASSAATNVKWTGGGDGKTLNDGSNWNGGSVPATTSGGVIETSGTLNLTANADFTAGWGGFRPKNGALTVNLDLGDYLWNGNALNGQYQYRFALGGLEKYPLVWNFTGGVITNMSNFIVGIKDDSNYIAGGYNTTATVSGSGTKVFSLYDHTTVGGSSGSTNNTLVVSGGAYFQSGRETKIGSDAKASGNLIRVTGEGTTFVQRPDNNRSKIGQGVNNRLLVEKNAKFIQDSSISTGTYLGLGTAAHDNRIDILSGATFDLTSKGKADLDIGSEGSDRNVFACSNATFAVNQNLDIGNSAKDADGACENLAAFGAGAEATVDGHVYIGFGAYAASNRLVVADAGTTLETAQYDLNVGVYGVGNSMEVRDGAKVTSARGVYVGGAIEKKAYGAGCDSSLVVSGSGSELRTVGTSDASGLFIGVRGGSNNVVRIADGAYAYVRNHVRLGYNEDACSNRLEVVDARLLVTNQLHIGNSARSSFNKVEVRGTSRVDLICGFELGSGAGANSNEFVIADGAVVSNVTTGITWSKVAAVGNDAAAIGNRMVVSNATFIGGNGVELFVNQKGVGNVFEALDGAQVVMGQSFRCGSDSSESSYGLIRAAGEGTVLTNTQYHLYVAGHHNGVSIEDGAKMFVRDQMQIGSWTGSVPDEASTNNYLRISNGTLYCPNSYALQFGYDCKLIWEGSRSSLHVAALKMAEGAEMEMVADKDGLAAFGPVYETYLADDDWNPTVKKIKVDLTEYLKANPGKHEITILRSEDNRTMRNLAGTDLSQQSAETIAAVNEAFRNLVEVTPADSVKSIAVDMTKSSIRVTARKRAGMVIVFR